MSKAGFTKDKNYQFLLEYFPANKIHLRFQALWADMVQVIDSFGLDNKLKINENSRSRIAL